MKNRFTVILFCLFGISARAQYEPAATGELIRHTFYVLDYNEQHEQPNWVFYRLTIDNVKGIAKRKDDFRPDPAVSTGSAELSDYKGSGYDRGHLCPAADMKQSDRAMSETFYLSNMSPQVPAFNRGKWAQAEKIVRDLIRTDTDTLYIVTGPVFIDNQGRIGKNGVTVPGYYFKAVYKPGTGMYALMMPNRKIDGPARAWQVSVDMVESLTGIDLFPTIPAEAQNKMEADVRKWE